MLNRDAIEREEEALRDRARKLSDKQRAEYFRQSSRAIRDPDTYAALNWGAPAGIHHFYLGRWQRGLLNLLGLVIAIVMLLNGWLIAGTGLIVLIVVIELFELFRAQRIVAHYNNQVMKRILDRIEP
jgi:hypothetical protein